MDLTTIGWIPFWNLYPFRFELQKQRSLDLELKLGFPTQVNKWLLEGKIQIGPCSSVCLVSHAHLEMAFPLGISSDGPVRSVYWGFYHEHLELLDFIKKQLKILQEIFAQAHTTHGFEGRKIAQYMWHESKAFESLAITPPPLNLPGTSAASAALSKIFYCLFFGKENYQLFPNQIASPFSGSMRPIELMIGDEALNRRSQFQAVLDLGSMWKEITGLPFVFAVWQSRTAIGTAFRKRFMEFGEKAESRMKVEPAAYLPSILPQDDMGKALPLVDYWKQLNYRLGPKELKGLVIFLCLARHLQSIPLDQGSIVKLMRWQELGLSRI